jgi:NTP pyrophosphatase (non-canonical NTP hydrolase)
MVQNDTIYEVMASSFVKENGLDSPEAQFQVVKEEVEELEAALNGRGSSQEEMADVLITVFVLAEIMGVDIHGEYVDKMEYNRKKSGKQDENGKVIDDV